jgi:hypothetical protein
MLRWLRLTQRRGDCGLPRIAPSISRSSADSRPSWRSTALCAAAAEPPQTLAQFVAASLQLRNAAIDRAPRDPRRHRNFRQSTTAQRHRLVGREQPTPPFVEKTGDPEIAGPKRFNINHRYKI